MSLHALLPLLPFAVLLLMIAACPLVCPKWWHKAYPFVAVIAALVTGAVYAANSNWKPLVHALEEYAGFIALVSTLYIVASGIHIGVKGESTPLMNCLFLMIGGVLANLIGTTGASMLLIRPWIRLNKYRVTGHHVVFFIFIVSNVGGCLTPIGDPPLFLGFLKGVPFWWTLQNLWKEWALLMVCLLVIFYVIDLRNFRRGPQKLQDFAGEDDKWSFSGLHNIFFLITALCSVFLPIGWREAGLVASTLGSWFTTPRHVHQANSFAMEPLKEVAWLFLGIFVTMIPALEFLQIHGAQIGPTSQMGYYWATGLLSGILDNAPTYLAFMASAFGQQGLSLEKAGDMSIFIASHSELLAAISLGAVFFGAMTYIGNGPNFMVKSISEHMGVKTPSFFRYILCYSLPILLPVLALAGYLFFKFL